MIAFVVSHQWLCSVVEGHLSHYQEKLYTSSYPLHILHILDRIDLIEGHVKRNYETNDRSTSVQLSILFSTIFIEFKVFWTILNHFEPFSWSILV